MKRLNDLVQEKFQITKDSKIEPDMLSYNQLKQHIKELYGMANIYLENMFYFIKHHSHINAKDNFELVTNVRSVKGADAAEIIAAELMNHPNSKLPGVKKLTEYHEVLRNNKKDVHVYKFQAYDQNDMNIAYVFLLFLEHTNNEIEIYKVHKNNK